MQRAAITSILRKFSDANLTVTFWDGTSEKFITNKSRPAIHITIADKGVARNILKSVSLGIGEAYMDERLAVEGPLEEFIALGIRNTESAQIAKHAAKFRKFNKNIKKNQKSQIAHHYDLGNDFYKLWLDPTLTYTCAYFKKASDTLEKAQSQKREHVLNKLQLKKGMTLLDIGCGWGELLIHAAKKYGARGLGVTLSEEQHRLAKQKIKQLGLTKQVDIKLMNYQDLPKLKRKFDRVVSVGFFEAVGKGNLDDYFGVIDKVLADGGITVLHTITSEVEAPSDPWIDKYIFPGGYIPSIREVTALFPSHRLFQKDYEALGPHYARTLRIWRSNVAKSRKKIIEMYDERFYRMWWFWLSASIASFETGSIGLSQWVLSKGYSDNWPLTREAYL